MSEETQIEVKVRELTPDEEARFDNNFAYHAPNDEQVEKYALLRAEAKQLAMSMSQHAPPSRELSLALTALEESVMWVNAAIARNG